MNHRQGGQQEKNRKNSNPQLMFHVTISIRARFGLSMRERYAAARALSTYWNTHNWTLSDSFGHILFLQAQISVQLQRLVTQRLLTDHPPATRQLSPMDPRALHPVVHGGPADSRSLAGRVNW